MGYSAGSRPRGEVHPHALKLLGEMNRKTADPRSKSRDEFAAEGAPALDFVFTIRGRVEGDEAKVRKAFLDAYPTLEARVGPFTAPPMEALDRPTLKKRLEVDRPRTRPARPRRARISLRFAGRTGSLSARFQPMTRPAARGPRGSFRDG